LKPFVECLANESARLFDQPPEPSVAWGLSNHHCEACTGSLNALLLSHEIWSLSELPQSKVGEQQQPFRNGLKGLIRSWSLEQVRTDNVGLTGTWEVLRLPCAFPEQTGRPKQIGEGVRPSRYGNRTTRGVAKGRVSIRGLAFATRRL